MNNEKRNHVLRRLDQIVESGNKVADPVTPNFRFDKDTIFSYMVECVNDKISEHRFPYAFEVKIYAELVEDEGNYIAKIFPDLLTRLEKHFSKHWMLETYYDAEYVIVDVSPILK